MILGHPAPRELHVWLPAQPTTGDGDGGHGGDGGDGDGGDDGDGGEVLRWQSSLERDRAESGGGGGGGGGGGSHVHGRMVSPLLTLTAHESGVPTTKETLQVS